MDKLDQRIIGELELDGRQTNIALATKLGVSEATVRRRIHRLLDEEIIKVTAVPDPAKVGIDTIAVVAIQVRLQSLDHVADALARNPNVHYVAHTAGQFDIVVWGLFHSTQELTDFLKRDVASIPGVERTETLINLDVKKRTLGWPSSYSEAALQ